MSKEERKLLHKAGDTIQVVVTCKLRQDVYEDTKQVLVYTDADELGFTYKAARTRLMVKTLLSRLVGK